MKNNDTMISLCVMSGPKRVVVKCDAKVTTVKQFFELAMNALDIPVLVESMEGSVKFYVDCFPQPRRPIIDSSRIKDTANDNKTSTLQSLHECGIRHQDKILVEVETSARASSPTGKTVNPEVSLASSTTKQSQRTRRKAAIAATKSFATTIQQQEEMLQVFSSPKSKRSAPATKSPSTIKTNSRHFANLVRSANSNEGLGRRLRDGVTTVQNKSPTNKHARTSENMNQPTDIIEGLVSATNSKTTGARLMRKGWRQAVESAYEQNQASARVAAAQSIDSIEFMIKEPSSTSSSQSNVQQLHVEYKKGVQGRGKYLDAVDYIDHDVLVATISAIYPSEALRSFHLALLSPRVFWSLLYHYKNYRITIDENESRHFDDIVHSALLWCCPNIDWGYLRRRPEQLSEKARENLRQKVESKNSNIDWDAAAAAIMSVEQAMDDMTSATIKSSINVVNGSNRDIEITNKDDFDDWDVFHETELLIDELIECLQSYTTTESVHMVHSYDINKVIFVLSEHLQIRNQSELANVDSEAVDLQTRLLTELLEEKQNSCKIPKYSAPNTVTISLDAINHWIEYAQINRASEVMYEIFDGASSVVDMLLDTVRCGTPRDLIFWESTPETLVETVHEGWRDVVKTHDSEMEELIEITITVPKIRFFCRRARIALEKLEWLTNYITPLEDDDCSDDSS
jgi:hypothetical protein